MAAGGVAVHRAEVALAVDQQVAHRERLRHAHDGVVHRRVAVRVVLADHVADDARGLLVGLVPVVAELAHREQHAAVHGLQAVAHVGQRAAHDHAHRVIEVRLLHLVFEIDVQDFAGDFGHESVLVVEAGSSRPKKRNNTTGRSPAGSARAVRFGILRPPPLDPVTWSLSTRSYPLAGSFPWSPMGVCSKTTRVAIRNGRIVAVLPTAEALRPLHRPRSRATGRRTC